MTELDLTPIKDRLWRARHLPAFLTEGDIVIAKAHEDIAALIAEVERLRAQVNELARLWDAVTDAVGVDTDSTRGEWQTAFDAKIESYHGHGYESGKRDEREENKRLSAQIDAERMAVDGIGQPSDADRNRFDRWLASHDRKVAAKALRDAAQDSQMGPVSYGWKNAYRDVVNAFKGVEQ